MDIWGNILLLLLFLNQGADHEDFNFEKKEATMIEGRKKEKNQKLKKTASVKCKDGMRKNKKKIVKK